MADPSNGFVYSLLSCDERAVDSIVVGGLAVLAVMIGLTIYIGIIDHTTWSPVNFGGGAATVISAVAAGKTVRDRFSPPPDGDQK